jgi:hypothetical protein
VPVSALGKIERMAEELAHDEIQKAHKALPEDFGPVPSLRAQMESVSEAGTKRKAIQCRGLAEMVEATARMRLYDGELLGISRKKKRKQAIEIFSFCGCQTGWNAAQRICLPCQPNLRVDCQQVVPSSSYFTNQQRQPTTPRGLFCQA